MGCRGSLDHTDLVFALRACKAERWRAPSWNTKASVTGWTVYLGFSVQSAFVVAEFRQFLFLFSLVLILIVNLFARCVISTRTAAKELNRNNRQQPAGAHGAEGSRLTDLHAKRQ